MRGINEHELGVCRTIKAQYQQTTPDNLNKTGTFGATGIGIDLSVCNPKTLNVANCISARQDRGYQTGGLKEQEW